MKPSLCSLIFGDVCGARSRTAAIIRVAFRRLIFPAGRVLYFRLSHNLFFQQPQVNEQVFRCLITFFAVFG